MYLNKFDWINTLLESDLQHIFILEKAKDLNIQESAIKVGMLKNPSVQSFIT